MVKQRLDTHVCDLSDCHPHPCAWIRVHFVDSFHQRVRKPRLIAHKRAFVRVYNMGVADRLQHTVHLCVYTMYTDHVYTHTDIYILLTSF